MFASHTQIHPFPACAIKVLNLPAFDVARQESGSGAEAKSTTALTNTEQLSKCVRSRYITRYQSYTVGQQLTCRALFTMINHSSNIAHNHPCLFVEGYSVQCAMLKCYTVGRPSHCCVRARHSRKHLTRLLVLLVTISACL